MDGEAPERFRRGARVVIAFLRSDDPTVQAPTSTTSCPSRPSSRKCCVGSLKPFPYPKEPIVAPSRIGQSRLGPVCSRRRCSVLRLPLGRLQDQRRAATPEQSKGLPRRRQRDGGCHGESLDREHHARQGDRHRPLDRGPVPARGAWTASARQRRAALSDGAATRPRRRRGRASTRTCARVPPMHKQGPSRPEPLALAADAGDRAADLLQAYGCNTCHGDRAVGMVRSDRGAHENHATDEALMA